MESKHKKLVRIFCFALAAIMILGVAYIAIVAGLA